jgi:hypothetical protein
MNTRQLWQAQALDAPRISLAFVRQQSDSLRRWTRMRNAINYIPYIAIVPFVVWRAWFIFSAMPLFAVGLLWTLASGLLLMVRWHKRAASQEQPEDLGVLDALKFHRRQLERQRDARRDRWRRWPAIPGILMMFVGLAVDVTPTPWKALGLLAVFIALVLSVATVVEERIARRIQKEIDALESL